MIKEHIDSKKDVLEVWLFSHNKLPCDVLPCDNTMYCVKVKESSKYDFSYITFVLCILIKGKYCLAITCKILPCEIENLSHFG